MPWLRNFLLTCGVLAACPNAGFSQSRPVYPSAPGYSVVGPVTTPPIHVPTGRNMAGPAPVNLAPPVLPGGTLPGPGMGPVPGPVPAPGVPTSATPVPTSATLGPPIGGSVVMDPAPYVPVPHFGPEMGPIGEPVPFGPAVCGSETGCQHPGHFWVNADYLYWFVSGNPTPALVTTGPAGQLQSEAGVLGVNGTQVVYGNERLNATFQSGFRLALGWWFDPQQRYGLSGSFAYFIPDEADFIVGPNSGSPIISRPYVDAAGGQHAAQVVRYPGVVDGTVQGTSRTSILTGDANLLFNLFHCETEQACHGGCPTGVAGYTLTSFQRLDFLMGYRYFRLSDEMNIDQLQAVLDQGVATGSTVAAHDRFYTRNDYHMANLGLNYRWQRDRLSLDLRPALGFAWLKGETDISGLTVVSAPPAAAVSTNGGLLALPTNIGNFRNQRFVWVPQLEAVIGYQLTDRIALRVGGSAMYFSKVLRAGDQIDTRLNTTQVRGGTLDGAALPQYPFNFTDLWVTGLNVSVEFRY